MKPTALILSRIRYSREVMFTDDTVAMREDYEG